MMELLDLPLELFRAVLEQCVVTLGLCRGIRLRLVCTLFDREIPNAFSATRLLELYPYHPVSSVSTSLLSKYLYDRTMADRTNSTDLVATIHYTVDYLLRHDEVEAGEQAVKLRRDYTRSLCATTATARQGNSANSWTLIRSLKPDSGVDNEWRGPNGLSHHYLAAAAYLGKIELVTKLIKKHTIDINGETYFGTPLQCAVKGGQCDVARLLLEQPSICVNAGLSDRKPLSIAAFTGNEDMVRLLLEPRYGCPREGQSFQQAIIQAARGGHQELTELLKTSGINSSTPSTEVSILYEAAHHGHANLVQIALDNGASSNASRRLWLSVCCAVSSGHDDVVRVLLARGATETGRKRVSALSIAVQGGFKSTVQLLLDHGYDDFNLKATNQDASTAPLKVAAEYGQAHMVRFILDQGFDLEEHREVAAMAIKMAAENGYETIVRMLCEAGVDVDGPTESMSPMLAALCRGRQNIVETLVELGAKRIDPEKSIYAEKFEDGTYHSGTKV